MANLTIRRDGTLVVLQQAGSTIVLDASQVDVAVQGMLATRDDIRHRERLRRANDRWRRKLMDRLERERQLAALRLWAEERGFVMPIDDDDSVGL